MENKCEGTYHLYLCVYLRASVSNVLDQAGQSVDTPLETFPEVDQPKPRRSKATVGEPPGSLTACVSWEAVFKVNRGWEPRAGG